MSLMPQVGKDKIKGEDDWRDLKTAEVTGLGTLMTAWEAGKSVPRW